MAAMLVCAAVIVPSAGSLVTLGVAGRRNANPSIAASGRFAAIAWGAATNDGTTDIYVAVSRDAGETFGGATRVNDDASRASLSGEQPPRVTLVPYAGKDPALVVVWTARARSGTRLLSARSDNGGKSFTRPTPLPGSDAVGNRGWEATATDRNGRVVAIWLDHRELATPEEGTAPNHSGHRHGAGNQQQRDGVARAQLSKLFFARLDSATAPQALTGGVCYCCKTAIAAGHDGAIYAAWRHVYPGNVRDIAFTTSRDGGRTFAPPARVSEDRWALDGCPENGPAMAVDHSGHVHVVWPTLVAGAHPGSEPTLALFYAMSRDGRRFTPRQRIPTEGFPRHPQMTLDTRGLVVTWDEQANGTRRIALARGTTDGTDVVRFVRRVIGDAQPAVYPVVATTDDGIVIAWTSGAAGQTVLHTTLLSS